MSAANVPIVVDKGEDFTAQIIYTDDFDQPLNMVYPIRMDVKGNQVSAILSLVTPEVMPTDGSIPEITFSPDIGLIQIHIDHSTTEALPPGVYNYDMFVTVDDEGEYAGTQQQRILYGTFSVNPTYTTM